VAWGSLLRAHGAQCDPAVGSRGILLRPGVEGMRGTEGVRGIASSRVARAKEEEEEAVRTRYLMRSTSHQEWTFPSLMEVMKGFRFQVTTGLRRDSRT